MRGRRTPPRRPHGCCSRRRRGRLCSRRRRPLGCRRRCRDDERSASSGSIRPHVLVTRLISLTLSLTSLVVGCSLVAFPVDVVSSSAFCNDDFSDGGGNNSSAVMVTMMMSRPLGGSGMIGEGGATGPTVDDDSDDDAREWRKMGEVMTNATRTTTTSTATTTATTTEVVLCQLCGGLLVAFALSTALLLLQFTMSNGIRCFSAGASASSSSSTSFSGGGEGGDEDEVIIDHHGREGGEAVMASRDYDDGEPLSSANYGIRGATTSSSSTMVKREGAEMDKCRSALVSHALLGLSVVSVALLNNRMFPPPQPSSSPSSHNNGTDTDEDGGGDFTRITELFLMCGSVFIGLASVGLMASFWPEVDVASSSSSRRNAAMSDDTGRRRDDDDDDEGVAEGEDDDWDVDDDRRGGRDEESSTSPGVGGRCCGRWLGKLSSSSSSSSRRRGRRGRIRVDDDSSSNLRDALLLDLEGGDDATEEGLDVHGAESSSSALTTPLLASTTKKGDDRHHPLLLLAAAEEDGLDPADMELMPSFHGGNAEIAVKSRETARPPVENGIGGTQIDGSGHDDDDEGEEVGGPSPPTDVGGPKPADPTVVDGDPSGGAGGSSPPNNDDEDDSDAKRGVPRLLQLASHHKPCLYVGCLVLLLRLPFSLAVPHFVSTTFGALGRLDYAAARMEILLLLVIGTIDAALDFWCVYLFGLAKERIVRKLRVDTFAAMLRQEVGFFDEHTTGELTSRLTADCGQMAGELTWVFRFSIEACVRVTGIAGYMMIRCPLLGLATVSIVPLVAFANKLYGTFLARNAKLVQTALAEANSVAQESFSCIRTVIAFATEEMEGSKYRDKIDRQYRLNVRQLFAQGVYYMVISTFLINTVVQASILAIGVALIQRGRLTAEVLLAFMLYQGQLQSYTLQLFDSYTSLLRSSGAGDKVFAILDRVPPEPATGSIEQEERRRRAIGHHRQITGAVQFGLLDHEGNVGDPMTPRSLHSGGTNVELRDVDFWYPTRPSNPVLQNLSLRIPAGRTVALVGPSGCGKSTIVNLIERFYDPCALGVDSDPKKVGGDRCGGGSVIVDGMDLRSLDVREHRRRVGIVTQEPTLFSGTILSNIVYGTPGASLGDARRAAELANARAFIESFPDGYMTEVGERGMQLSGGQKQRIAIARAIVKRPSILLLDEATSALDSESERLVQAALDRLLYGRRNSGGVVDDGGGVSGGSCGGVTTVVVAHRLRTVRNADLIAVVRDGRVVELGPHDDLVKLTDGHYRRMVEVADASNTGLLPE